jgi:replication factor A1
MIVLTVHLPWTYDVLSFFAVDLLKPDATVIVRNAKIDMFKGSMRLAVDKWGRIEATEPASFTVKEDNNLSLVEYELVNVAE